MQHQVKCEDEHERRIKILRQPGCISNQYLKFQVKYIET